jgi:hypothetical protein
VIDDKSTYVFYFNFVLSIYFFFSLKIDNNSLANNMLAYESYDEDEDDNSNETNRSLYYTIKSQPPRYTNNIVDYLYKM